MVWVMLTRHKFNGLFSTTEVRRQEDKKTRRQELRDSRIDRRSRGAEVRPKDQRPVEKWLQEH